MSPLSIGLEKEMMDILCIEREIPYAAVSDFRLQYIIHNWNPPTTHLIVFGESR